MHPKAAELITELKLKVHPEGGYYRETFRSDEILDSSILPDRYNRPRVFSTSIYFLLEGEQLSKFHKLRSDELWYHHKGTRGIIYILDESGDINKVHIGDKPIAGDEFQVLIKRNNWFCAEVEDKSSFFLAGCNVSPGFEFADFELADRNQLLDKFPGHKEIILKFT